MKNPARLALFLTRYKGWVSLSILLSSAAFLSGTGLLTTSAYIIALAALKPNFAALQLAIVGVRFFGISRGVFRYLERLASHSVNLRFLAGIRMWLYGLLEERMPFHHFQFSRGDLFNRITSDIETLEDLFVRMISPLISAILITFAISYIAWNIHPQFFQIILLGMLLSGALMLVTLAWATMKSGAMTIKLRASFSDLVRDAVDGNTEIHTYALQDNVLNKFFETNNTYSFTEKRYSSSKALATFLSILVPGFTLIGILWLGTDLVYKGEMDGIYLAVVVLLVLSGFEAINPLTTTGEVYSKIRESADRLFGIAAIEPAVKEPLIPVQPGKLGIVNIQHLCFRYPGSQRDLLKNIDLQLSPGKIVALVGPTGSGKSTIVNLLLRMWDFERGNIFIDGLDIKEINPDVARQHFAVMNQQSYIFSKSIYENLSLANTGSNPEKIKSALETTGLMGWVDTLPENLDTQIGQNGIFVSAGQRQRLLIARMLLMDSPVMILDEPSANLDSVSENLLWQELLPILKMHSVLWITHRLVNMEQMDEILFLNDGSIIERGTHTELLQMQGFYFNMWNIQNRILIDKDGPFD